MKRRTLMLVTLLCWVGGLLTAFAQTSNVTLNSVVKDKNDSAITGAKVTVTNAETGFVRTGVTDESGRCTLLSLPAGAYDVSVGREGFATSVRRNQQFEVGTTVTLDFSLDVGAVTNTVEVTADAPVIETSQNVLSRVVQTQELDRLPVINRSFSELAGLSPGVQVTSGGPGSGVSIGNSQAYQTEFILDSTSIKNPLTGNPIVNMAQDWIREFSVLAGQYPAEYSNASGGVVNAITRSGGNEFHGRGYGYFQDVKLNSNPWVLPPAVATKVPYNQQRIGGMIGGPIRQSKLFFFGGYEYLHNLTTRTVSIPAAFTGPGIGSGNFPNDTRNNLAIAKIDYNVNQNNLLGFRLNVDRNRSTNNGIGGTRTESNATLARNPAIDAGITWNRTLSATAVNEFRFGFQRPQFFNSCNFITLAGSTVTQGNPVGGYAQQAYPAVTLGCSPLFGIRNGLVNARKTAQIYDSLSKTIGSHQLKFGGQYYRQSFYSEGRNNTDGQYGFGAVAGASVPFTATNAATFPLSYQAFYAPDPSFDFKSSSYGLFAQDTWRVVERLTLNYGLRYDLDRGFSDLAKFAPAGFNKIKPPKNGLAPRFGFTFSPFKDNKTVLRGGVGVFLDNVPGNIQGVYLTNTVQPAQPGGVIFNIAANRPGLNPYCVGNAACAASVPAALQTAARAVLANALANRTIPVFPAAGGTLTVGGVTYTLPALPLVPGTTTLAPTGSANEIDTNIKIPKTVQYSFGLQHDFGYGLNASADYVYVKGKDQLILRNINTNPTTLALVNPKYQSVNSFGNGGEFTSKSLRVQAGYRSKRGDALQLAYTYTIDATSNSLGSFGISSRSPLATNPFDYNVDFGPASNYLPHNLNLSGNLRIPFGINLSSVLTAASGAPYNATTTAPVVAGCLSFYSQCYPAGFTRNSLRGDKNVSLNTRLAKTVNLGEKRALSVFFEAYNLANRTNFLTYQTNVTAATFSRPTSAGARRQLQIGARFDF